MPAAVGIVTDWPSTVKTTFRHISKPSTYAVLAKYLGSSAYVRSKDRVKLWIP